MMTHLPLALLTTQRLVETELRSALPGAPVVQERGRREAKPRTYRTRAALAARLARATDAVAPRGWTPSHDTASSR